ncbi:MAG: hypothetical protein V1487_01140 [bacterium]
MWKWVKNLHKWCNRHEWILFLIVVILVLRAPSLIMPHYYGDEEIYFVMGRAWRSGVPLYQAMFDHKPPLIYILAGLAPTMLAFRGLLAGMMILHTVLFWELAKRFWQKTRPFMAYVSSAIFVLLTTLPTLEGLTVNAELLMMVPVTAGVLLLWNSKQAEWKKYGLAGLLLGLGWLYKIPVAADAAAIGLFFLVFKQKSWRASLKALFSKSMMGYILGFVTPLAMTFAYYYLKGHGGSYLDTVLTMNLGYVSSWSTSAYTFNPFKSGLVVRGTILAVMTTGLYLARKKLDKSLILALLWFSYALFGALLSARPYPHYLQEPVVPFALLVPYIFVAESLLSWILLGVVAGSLLLMQRQVKFWGYPTMSVYQNFWQYVNHQIGSEEYLARFDNAKRNYAIAKYLNERLSPTAQIYLWGSDATIYNLTERLPAGGKYIVSFHVHDLKKENYVIDQLQKSRPKYIVKLPGSEEFTQLDELIEREYILVNNTLGAEIYIRL